MNISQLRTFSAVISEHSMTAAAQKLYLTQSAVSQQIRQLEVDLGIELLVRGVRQITPTPAGSILYEYAKKILNLVEQAEIAVQTVGAEAKGPLRIGTLNSIGLQLISQNFGLFLKNNQEVTVKLTYAQGLKLLQQLQEGQLDVIIVPESKKEFQVSTQSLESRLIIQDEMWLVAGQSQADVPDEIQIHEIVKHPIVHLSEEYPGFENTLNKELKKSGVNARPIFESSNVGTVKRVIESGAGWGFLPAHSVRKQIRQGRMRRIELMDFEYKVELVAYYPSDLKSSKVVEVFFKSLQGQFS